MAAQQQAELKTKTEQRRGVDSRQWSLEHREKEEESECDHSIMWHVPVCVSHDGRRNVTEQAILFLIAYNYRYTHRCTHKLITEDFTSLWT